MSNNWSLRWNRGESNRQLRITTERPILLGPPEGIRLHFLPLSAEENRGGAGALNYIPATIMSLRPQSYGPRSQTHGLSHGLTKCPPDTWLHQCAHWCRPFESIPSAKNADIQMSIRIFHVCTHILIESPGMVFPF